MRGGVTKIKLRMKETVTPQGAFCWTIEKKRFWKWQWMGTFYDKSKADEQFNIWLASGLNKSRIIRVGETNGAPTHETASNR